MRVAAQELDAEHTRLPVWVGQTIWSNLPLLLAIDAVLFVGAIPAVALFFGGGFLLTPLVGALTLGPLWAGTVAATDRMVRNETVSVVAFARSVRQYAMRGITVSVVPALVATAILGTLYIMEARPDEQWLFVPLLADGSVATLVFLAGFSAFSLATTGGLKGWTLWRVALEMIVASPMAAVVTVALLALLGLLVNSFPGLLPVFPALLAVHLSASTQTAIRQQTATSQKS